MYKVFFNQKPLVLTDKILETSDLSPLIFIKYTTASLIIKALKSKNNEKGVFWGKKGKRDKELKQFYKEHIYTFVDENDLSRKEWVRISGFMEEEQ